MFFKPKMNNFFCKGLSPKEACCSVLTSIKRTGEEKCFEIALIALNIKVHSTSPATVCTRNAFN